MTLLKATQLFFTRAIDFTGRATRPEFWWPILLVNVLAFAAAMIAGALGAEPEIMLRSSQVVWLVLALPILSVSCRRLQDTSISGVWIGVFVFAGIVGGLLQAIVWLVFLGLFCVASSDRKVSAIRTETATSEGDMTPKTPLQPIATEAVSGNVEVAETAEEKTSVFGAVFQSFIYTFRHAFVFSGRASRAEFASFILPAILIGFLLLGAARSEAGALLYLGWEIVTGLVSISLHVRRLHDFDVSGVWLLAYLVPLPFTIIPGFGQQFDAKFWVAVMWCSMMVLFLFFRGTKGPNHFGPDPAGLDAPSKGQKTRSP